MLMVRSRSLASMMLGHFSVDAFAGVIPVMYPLLIHRFTLNLETVALVGLAYSGCGAISQPLFGILADRFGTRLIGLALVWSAGLFAAVGFAASFPALVGTAAVAGIGSGAFHPMGAITVRRLAPLPSLTAAMSWYVTSGTLGIAAGPLLGVLLLSTFGLHGTAGMAVPGVVAAAVLFSGLRGSESTRPGARTGERFDRRLALPLAATIVVMASRSWTNQTLMAFTPTWYHSLGYPPWFYGALATTIVLSSAIGTLGTGTLAARHGKRAVIVATMTLTIPAILLFAAFPGPLGFLWAVALGALAGSTPQLMLMIAQELLSRRAGFASGLILGLGFVTAAFGAPVTGAVADHVGLRVALGLQVVVVLLTIPVALALPREEKLRSLAVSASHAEPAAEVPA